MDLLLALIELSVEFGVARWVTYLQKEKGAPAGGGAGAETEDDEEGATLARGDAEGSDGQWRRRRRCGLLVGLDAGMGLELTRYW